jgi:hypothetical protein
VAQRGARLEISMRPLMLRIDTKDLRPPTNRIGIGRFYDRVSEPSSMTKSHTVVVKGNYEIRLHIEL